MQGDAGVVEEVQELSFAPSQSLLRPLALADVAEYEHASDNAAAFVANGCSSVFDRPLAAVPRDEEVVGRGGRQVVVAQHLGDRVFDGGPRLLVDDADDVAQLLAQGL